MPKKKRARGRYGNIITEEFQNTYIDTWSNNKEDSDDILMLSLLIKTEGSSLIQIIVSENPLYNGIYHIIKFKYKSGTKNKIICEDVDVLHDPKKTDLEGLIEQLPEIARKHQGILPDNLPLDVNPFEVLKELPVLIIE